LGELQQERGAGCAQGNQQRRHKGACDGQELGEGRGHERSDKGAGIAEAVIGGEVHIPIKSADQGWVEHRPIAVPQTSQRQTQNSQRLRAKEDGQQHSEGRQDHTQTPGQHPLLWPKLLPFSPVFPSPFLPIQDQKRNRQHTIIQQYFHLPTTT